jgi:hypothetical protein
MSSSPVWTALSRLWKPAPETARVVDDTKITGEATIRRTLERLARAGTMTSL